MMIASIANNNNNNHHQDDVVAPSTPRSSAPPYVFDRENSTRSMASISPGMPNRGVSPPTSAKQQPKSFGQKIIKSLTPKLKGKKKVIMTDRTISLESDETTITSFHDSDHSLTTLDPKEEAVRSVQKTIKSFERKREELKKQMQSDAQMAMARYESTTSNLQGPAGNPRGAIISMKRYKQGQLLCKHLQNVIANLQKLLTSIENDETSPDNFKAAMKQAVEGTRSKKVEYSDEELLNELSGGTILQQMEDE